MNRANAERSIILRTSGKLTAVGLDADTMDGGNEDLNDVIVQALEQMGYSAVDPTSVTDDDLASVIAGQVGEFMEYAVLFTLRLCLTRTGAYDERVGEHDVKLSQVIDGIQAAITEVSATIKLKYGGDVGASEPARLKKRKLFRTFQEPVT